MKKSGYLRLIKALETETAALFEHHDLSILVDSSVFVLPIEGEYEFTSHPNS